MKRQKNAPSLAGKNIVVGVTGGIACYKTCELVRMLDAERVHVVVVMTKAATQFVTPMTFQALSRNPVHTDIFDLTQESQMGHIQLADSADLMVVAPATADFIAKAAHGICDDLLTTILCVTRAPVLMAPSMNVHMYENRIVQKNIAFLKNHGYPMIGPAFGSLACGYEGLGRMPESVQILEEIKKTLNAKKKK